MKHFILLLFLFFGCDGESESSSMQSNDLTEKRKVIEGLSLSANCNDPSEWRFMPIGS